MKKLLYITIPIAIALVFIMFVWIEPINNMIYLEDIRVNELTKYKIDTVNDIGKMSKLNTSLPGNISLSGGGLAWESNVNIQVTYGYYGGNQINLKRLERFWKKNKEKVLLFNATTFFILIPNAQKVTMELDVPYQQKFEVTRGNLETFYGKDLNEYFINTNLWEKEVIKETINSTQRLKAFFQTHKIEKIE